MTLIYFLFQVTIIQIVLFLYLLQPLFASNTEQEDEKGNPKEMPDSKEDNQEPSENKKLTGYKYVSGTYNCFAKGSCQLYKASLSRLNVFKRRSKQE